MGSNRSYDFVTGFETSTAPTATTPSADADIMNKGYADDTYAKLQYWGDAVADNTALKAIGASDRFDKQARVKADDNTIWKFDSASSATDDGTTVLQPTVGTGRWLVASSSGGSSSGGASIEIVDMLCNQKKSGVETSVANPNLIAEAFTSSDTLSLTLVKDYATSDGAVIYLHPNREAIDAMDATTGWTASTGSVALNNTGGQFFEGTGSVKHTVTTLSGAANISKTLSSFNLTNKHFRAVVYLDTITNLTKLTVKLESSASNDATWDIPVAQLAVGFNLINVDPTSTPSASTGTFVSSAVVKAYLGLLTGASQTVNLSWDDICTVDSSPLVTSEMAGLTLPIYNASVQEMMVISSEDSTLKGKYTMSGALGNNYTRAASAAKLFSGTVSGQLATFESGASGDHAKTVHFINRALLPETQSSKKLKMTATFNTDAYAVYDFPSTTTLRLSTDLTARFLSGDRIVLFQYEKTFPGFASKVNSTISKNFKILTMSTNSTYSAPYTTITHTGTNAHGSNNSNWYVIRLSVFLKYFVGTLTASEVLTELTPTSFQPIGIPQATPVDTFTRSVASQLGMGTGPFGVYTQILRSAPDSAWVSDVTSNEYRFYDGSNGRSVTMAQYISGYSMVENELIFQYKAKVYNDASNDVGRTSQFGISIGANGTAGNSSGMYVGLFHQSATANAKVYLVVRTNGYGGTTVSSTLIYDASIAAVPYWNVKTKVNRQAKTLQVKYWDASGAEPANYQVNYSFSAVTIYPQWTFEMGATSISGSDGGRVYVDDFSIISGATGYMISGEAASQSGDKIVLDAVLDRQDTTNDLAAVRKFGGILV